MLAVAEGSGHVLAAWLRQGSGYVLAADSEDSGQVLAPEGNGYVLIFQLVGHVDEWVTLAVGPF